VSGPSAEQWWPTLSIDAKHRLISAIDHADDGSEVPIPEAVRDEIAEITGETLGDDRVLTDDEREFIATQREFVD